jgi:hypothetical protein
VVGSKEMALCDFYDIHISLQRHERILSELTIHSHLEALDKLEHSFDIKIEIIMGMLLQHKK